MTDQVYSFHYRTVGVATHEHHILLHKAEGDLFWSLPGGHVEVMEHAKLALKREMREELSAEVAVGDLIYIVENFFYYHHEHHHELGLYFTITFDEDSPFLDKTCVYDGIETTGDRLIFQWFPFEALDGMLIHPQCLIPQFAQPINGVGHFINDDRRK